MSERVDIQADRMRVVLPVLAAAIAVVSCAESDAPNARPAEVEVRNALDPVTVPVAEPPELASGMWSRGRVQGRPALLFGDGGSDPVFVMSCDTRDGIVLERRGLVATGEVGMMELSFDGVHAFFAVDQLGNDDESLRAAIPFNDDVMTELRDVDGPITVSVDRSHPLVMRSSPLIADLVLTCERS